MGRRALQDRVNGALENLERRSDYLNQTGAPKVLISCDVRVENRSGPAACRSMRSAICSTSTLKGYSFGTASLLQMVCPEGAVQ